MSNPSSKNIIKNIIFIFLVLGFPFVLFAQGPIKKTASGQGISETKKETTAVIPKVSSQEEESLSELQKQARDYRAKGFQLQQMGNLESALSYYQKAIELDPSYAIVYNDLGVIYEANGQIDRAEDSYLQSIKTDPNYLSAYSNLALLYEHKRDLKKAAFYWQKRVKLGSPDDPWTERARKRLEDIRLVLGDMGIGVGEQEVVDLTQNILDQKALLRQSNKELAKYYFKKAKVSYKKGDEIGAFRQAVDAFQLDPNNDEIQEFIAKLQTRLLSK